jgi:hypothetical protein
MGNVGGIKNARKYNWFYEKSINNR